MGRHVKRFVIEIQIDDLDELKLAAERRAVEEGETAASWHGSRSGPDDDIIMLLDPGALAGCTLLGSSCNDNDEAFP